jgi:hypothetical protein
VLPCEPAKQNRNAVPLFGSEGALHGAMEVSGLIESGNFPQAHALCFQSLLDFRVIFNLDEIRRHEFLRRQVESWCMFL